VADAWTRLSRLLSVIIVWEDCVRLRVSPTYVEPDMCLDNTADPQWRFAAV
jgi:hypothetical protein